MFSTLVVVLGTIWLIILLLKILYNLYDFFQSRLRPVEFAALGEWAVVTGSTDGIGKSIAKELARRKMNVILISRTESKLKETAREIEHLYKVKTYCIQADFADRKCHATISRKLDGKDIGVLVNNVGMALLEPARYDSLSEDLIWNQLDINCGAAAMLTKFVLPQMKLKKKGLIVNISSIASITGLPFIGNYSATKSFVNLFSYNIREELRRYNVKVKCLTPGGVDTKILLRSPSINYVMEKFPLLIPDPDTYAKYALNNLSSKSTIICGYWAHAIQAYIFGLLPTELRVRLVAKSMRN